MNTNPRQTQLADILDLGSAMLEKAQAEDWLQVAAMEAEQQRRLTEFFAVAVTPEEASAVADGIRRMLDINAQLLGMGEQLRQQAACELSNLGLGRRASEAYNQNR